MKNNTDILEPWLININLKSQKLNVEGVHDDHEGFRILLKGENTDMLRIKFNNKISYMNTDESYRLDLGRNNKKGTITNMMFFVVKNSSFLKWIKATSKQSLHPEVKHFAIYTEFDCIDIIAEDSPLVEWLG